MSNAIASTTSKEGNDNLEVVLLYLHKHRVNDLKNWLKSLAFVSKLQVTLIVSNNTKAHVDVLLDTNHQFKVVNIEQHDVEGQRSLKGYSIVLLWREFKGFYIDFKRRYKSALKTMSDYPDAVLVTYDDRITSLSPILKACHRLNIPVFLPAILTTTPDFTASTANTLKPKRKIETCITWFAKKCFPNHVNQEGRLFYSALSYLVLLMFGSVPKKPWVKGSLKFTSKLGVESQLAFEKLNDAGVSKEKLVITGMPVYDLMDFSRDDSITEKLLLCALPQYGEHGAMHVEQALPIIEEIMTAFDTFSGKVVISLHPRMSPEVYKPLVEKHGFHCVVGNIDSWLKRATLFFAASSSTTIYSSLIMGVRTVALNHISPSSNVFRDFESIVYVEKDALSEISEVIHHPNLNWKELLKTDQQLLSSSLVTDGNCGLRNLQVMQKLIET